MKWFTKLPYEVDVTELRAQLEANPKLWDQHKQRRTTGDSPHARMTDIWVRYNDIRRFTPETMKNFNDEHVPIWYPSYYRLPALKPILFDLMAHVQGEMLGGVLITRIPPGCGIGKHVDGNWHVDYYDKFYVSVESAEGANFWSGDEFINPKPGDIYRFDNRNEHWVENNSNVDRITLIVCIRTDKYRKANENPGA